MNSRADASLPLPPGYVCETRADLALEGIFLVCPRSKKGLVFRKVPFLPSPAILQNKAPEEGRIVAHLKVQIR